MAQLYFSVKNRINIFQNILGFFGVISSLEENIVVIVGTSRRSNLFRGKSQFATFNQREITLTNQRETHVIYASCQKQVTNLSSAV